MARTPSMLDTLAEAYAARAALVSLHTADPGTTGAGEVVGGTYARATITWTSDNLGTVTGTATINVPGGTEVTDVGLWDSTGGFLDSAAGAASYPVDGTAEITLTYVQG